MPRWNIHIPRSGRLALALLVLLGASLAARPASAQPPSAPLQSVLSAGGLHTCALTVQGAADCWGTAGPAQDRAGPFTALSAGFAHTCALTLQGAADCWGDNDQGQATDQAGPFGPYRPPERAPAPQLRRVWLPQVGRPQ